MTATEIAADAFLIIGAGLAIAAGSVVALWLGLLVAAILCLVAGAALTGLAMKKAGKPPKIPGRHGPFEPDS